MEIRSNWTLEELIKLDELPLMELIAQSHAIHTRYHKIGEIQECHLISIKTGGCPEDCKYCAQSSRYQTAVSAAPMMTYEVVIEEARKAVQRGATRICLGAAWREVRDGKAFNEILRMIKGIADLDVEVCCTLGMLNEAQAMSLQEAGLCAYNHNLDTSESYYSAIITTRTYRERLNTLDVVEKAELKVCCGGILGLGESPNDRLELLLTLCRRDRHPESVPINCLSPIRGTPLEDQPKVSIWEVIRIVAIARVIMPKAMIRLSSGRIDMSFEQQALAFIAGANSIFAGEKLLTVSNTPVSKDEQMFKLLGLKKSPPNTYSKKGPEKC